MTDEVRVGLSTGRPLAPMQRSLWASQRLHPHSPLQNMVWLSHLDAPVDADRLCDAFAAVVAASDVLRTRVVEHDGAPRVHLDARAADRVIVRVARDDADRWAAERASTPIDIAVRCHDTAVLVHEDGTVSWYLALHHIVTDAASSALVFDATAAAYAGESPAIGSYYRWAASLDAAQTEPSKLVRRRDRARDHWSQRNAAPGVARLYRPAREPGAAAARVPVSLPAELWASVEERLATDFKMLSPDLAWSALLITATAAYLYQVGGVDDFSIGMPVHNRADDESRAMVGPAMEVFPVDVHVEAGQTLRSLHRHVSRSIMSTLANAFPGTAPVGDYSSVVNVIRGPGARKFGEIHATTRRVHSGAIDAGHLVRVQMSALDGGGDGRNTGSRHDGDSSGSSMLWLDINRSGADDEHIERAGEHFRTVLTMLAENPDESVGSPLHTQAESSTLARWESAPDFASEPQGVVARLRARLDECEDIVLRDPTAGTDVALTGRQVWRKVQDLAEWLGDQGVGAGDRVGIALPRSADAVIAIVATLVAGASFVPLDVAQPERRRRMLTERAGCAVVLTALPDLGPGGSRPECNVGSSGAAVDEPPADAEAYLLFTSGSTGEPKGVPISHRGLARYLAFASDSYVESAGGVAPVVAFFSALSFDLTLTSLFLPLIVPGGEMIVITADGPAALTAIAKQRRINWCKATPSHLDVLVRLLPADHSLTTVVVGGEAFGAGLARKLLDFNADLAIFNEYGPTEAVVGCMIHRVDPDLLDDHPEVPIGGPAPGVTLRVVGPELERVPIGAVGELCIAHAGVTDGYLVSGGRPEDESADKFATLDGHRFYRSGDLVRLADPDTLIYLGRIDEQVKVGGIRLEPTEVEEALAEHPAIERAAVRLWSPKVSEPDLRCVRCGLASNVPGIAFDERGVCDTCHAYDRIAPQAESWFRTVDDLRAKQEAARTRRTGRHDCLHLLSGGKDSTYALYQLVELGFEPYVLTLDNGFISEGALDNARKSVAELGLDHEIATSDAMNAIFRDSLERHSNVCHGCYKTIYTLATNRAVELGIPMIVTGLSRGQLFETRLLPQQFAPGRFDPDAIDRAVVEARKAYHRLDDGPNRLLDTDVFATDDVFEQVEYLDFYRYVDVELAEMLAYLDTSAPWVRPKDTGRSTNCLINAAGISTHLREQGFHNYAVPYAWDVRLGHKTRDEAVEELDDQLDDVEVERLLAEVGYQPHPPEILTAWIQSGAGHEVPSPAELRTFLGEAVPKHAIPNAFVAVDEVPMTVNGKLDTAALPQPRRTHRAGSGVQVAAETELEAAIIDIWEQVLRTEPIGAEDDFFALGGDSLAALEMAIVVSEATGRHVEDDLAFLHTTPRDLAAAIDTLDPDHAVATEEVPSARSWGAAPLDEAPPLSGGELAILFEQSHRPDSVMYNVGRLYRVGGSIDSARFEAALEEVAAAHVPLSWGYGAHRRRLDRDAAVLVETSAPIAAAELADAARDEHRRPFDLENGPLVRGWICPLDNGTTAVLLTCHHVSGDAESFERLWSQIDAVYRGGSVPDLHTDYATFTGWQRSLLTDTDRQYWLPLDDHGAPVEPARLALGRAGSSTGVNPIAHGLDDGFVTSVASVTRRQLTGRAGSTGFAMVLAALTATLRRYSEGDRVALQMISSSRAHPAADDLVGYFLNPLPVEVDCAPDERLGEVVTRVGATAARHLAHRTYPYAQIVADRREVGVPQPAIEVLVAYDELRPTTFDGLPTERRVLSNGSAVTDATFFVEVHGDRVDISLEYSGRVLDASTATQLLSDFDTMLETAVARPETHVSAVELASSSVLDGPSLDAPHSLMPAIAAHVVAQPGGVAVRCDGTSITWADLGSRSAAIGQRLSAAGVGRGDRVIVNLGRTSDLIPAILGVLSVGAAYVPIDPTYPAERVALIASAASARAALVEAPSSLTSNDIVMGDVGPIAGDDAAPRWRDVGGGDVAYVIFTSGSTGRPRGVAVTHAELAASTTARHGVYDAAPERFLLSSSAAFDSSVVGLFWTLASGGTIVLPTDRQAHDPDAMLEMFGSESVTHTLMVPTLYQALLQRGADQLAWPRHAIVAGEACTAALVQTHHTLRPATRLTNEYGPTEATVWATAHHCLPAPFDADPSRARPVPIGVPIPGAWVAVVDADDRPVPHGVEGQLVIGGAGIVSGYLDDAAATSAKFGSDERGRFFRSGDRALVADGAIRFLGRIDDQLNVGGVRAEPEDIERVLLSEPSVGAAVVTASDPRSLDELVAAADATQLAAAMRDASSTANPAASLSARLLALDPSGPSAVRLVAHLEPASSVPVDIAAVRRRVDSELPALIRPTGYGIHASLPRTPNGKIDRAAAQHLDVSPESSRGPLESNPTMRSDDAAAGQHEAALVALFGAILRRDDVGPAESFFDIGGHSLLAMELLLQVERRFDVEVTVTTLYDHPTPRALAVEIERLAGGSEQYRYLVPIQPFGGRPPIFGVHVLGINARFYRPLAAELGPDQPLLGLGQTPVTNQLDTTVPTDVAEIAQQYCDEIVRYVPNGPVTLAAVSLGGVVAFDLAQQLRARGREVTLLALFDAEGPNAAATAVSKRQRVIAHTIEFRQRPSTYLARRVQRFRERGVRRIEIISLAVRRKLGRTLDNELRIRQFIEDNYRSQHDYDFDTYPGAVAVFKGRDNLFTNADVGMGWEGVVAGPLVVTPVAGGHLSMLEVPHVAELANQLRAAIDRSAS